MLAKSDCWDQIMKIDISRIAIYYSILSLLILSGCSNSSEQHPVVKIESCSPQDEPAGNVNLRVVSFDEDTEGVLVRVIAETGSTGAIFELPVYRMSAGRWLIGDNRRAYLIDDTCREYRLKDRRSVSGERLPLDGRVRLLPQKSFEMTLVFPRLIKPRSRAPEKKTESMRKGVLVYGKRALSFTFRAQS
jgi:hypothetical protein